MFSYFLTFIILHQLVHVGGEESILIQFVRHLVLSRYDSRLHPDDFNDGSTRLEVSIEVTDIYSISDIEMEYSVDFLITRKWQDKRLALPANLEKGMKTEFLTFRLDLLSQIWRPDLYFPSERGGSFHVVTKPYDVAFIHKDGTVYYTSRVSGVFRCPMDLRAFPLDSQICPLVVQSYAYDDASLYIAWADKGDDVSAVKTSADIDIAEFYLTSSEALRCDKGYAGASQFSCIKIEFHLDRKFQIYLITIYIPNAVIVGISWCSFWIPPDSVPGRVGIGSTTVLTIFTQIFFLGLRLPQVPYVKAADSWMAVCMLFIFASVAEFAVANVLLRIHNRRLAEKRDHLAELNAKAGKDAATSEILAQIAEFLTEMAPENEPPLSVKIDRVSRVAFPVSFLIFIIVYTAFYVHYAQKNAEKFEIT